jgi:hypothetical protein
LQDTNLRIVVGLNEDGYCDCIHYDDPIMEKYVGWTCDRCNRENVCPFTMHEILYMDQKLPLEIQAEIKSLEIHGQIMYGPRSQAYRNAKNNFENICQQWKGD